MRPSNERRKAEASRKADLYIGKDGGAPSPDVERTLAELAEMSPAEYGRRREIIAEKVGTSRKFLDDEYDERRKAAKDGGASDFLRDPEPWPHAVKGAELLDEIKVTVAKHIVLPDGGAEAIALWVLFAHCHDCFDVSPLLTFTSATPECGKSTALTLVEVLVPRALSTSNITPAAVFRTVEKWSPTLIIDEADTFLGNNDELRGILNSGHHRANAYVLRLMGDNHEPKRFCTWAPKVVALIGKLPPTLASRAIHVRLKRMLPDDSILSLRIGGTGHLDPLFRKAARWAADYDNDLRSAADPTMPEALYGRAADNWRPLIAIADCAGADWPNRARQVATLYGGRHDDLAHIMLLGDLRAMFDEEPNVQMLKSEEITEALKRLEHRPWPEWRNSKPMTARQLAKLLEPFGIVPKQHWLAGGVNRRGYHIEQFHDAFKRYQVPSRGKLSAVPLDALENNAASKKMPLGAESGLAATSEKKSQKINGSSGLAHKKPSEPVLDTDNPFEQANDLAVVFEERAAILEYDGGFSRVEANARAAEEFPELPAFLDRRRHQ